MKWGGELSDKELGKAEVLSTFFVLVFPGHICSTASLVPRASAKWSTTHGRRWVVLREPMNHWMQTQRTPVHGAGWGVSKAELRRSWQLCFFSAWSRESKEDAFHCLVGGWWEDEGRLFLEACRERTKDNKWGVTREILITCKEKIVHYEAGQTLRQAAKRGLEILRP